MRDWFGFWRVIGSSDGLDHGYDVGGGYDSDAFRYKKGFSCVVYNQFF
ncbi:hypothetical protein [Marinomonas alcarazii]|nr:hypothetical protein [Marinomonas alcarazii]